MSAQSHNLLHAAPVPIAVHELILNEHGEAVDYRFTDCNQAFADLLKKTAGEIIGELVTVLLPGTARDKAGWISRYAKVAQEGTAETFEEYSTVLSRWFRVHAFQTQPGFFTTIAEDITQQHLLNQEIRLRRTISETFDGATRDVVLHCQLQPSYKITYISPSIEQITGYTEAEIYQNSDLLDHIVHHKDLIRLRALFSDQHSLPGELRMRWIHKNGTIIWISLHSILQRNNDGAVIGLDAIASDISREKMTEEALENNQIQFSQILSAVSDIVIFYENENLEISWADHKAEQSITSIRGSLHKQKCHYMWGNDSSEPCRNCPVLRCFKTHKEEWIERSLPDHRHWLIHASPVLSPSGKFLGVVETAKDITQRVRMEAELQNAMDKVDSASLIKDQFIANISHELRTPLNGIIGIAELIDDSKLEDSQRELMKLIRQSGYRLYDVVQEILSFSMLDTDQLRDRRIRFRIHTVCSEIYNLYRDTAHKKRLDFTFTIDADVPDWLVGYPGKIRQLLKPLIDNALKFTSVGFVRYRVELDQKNPLQLRFTVQDSGCGIPEKARPKIFEAFYQVDGSLTRCFGGIGLGLTLARRQARDLSTELLIESSSNGDNRGTMVACTIRLEEAFAQTNSNEPKDQTLSRDSYSNNGKKPAQKTLTATTKQTMAAATVLDILIVEDDLINQRVTDALLRSQGHKTSITSNGRQAIEVLYNRRFDLILMDIQMPEMDGLEATRIIRAPDSAVLDHEVPIIAVSAFSQDDERHQCLEAGINTFLGKPVSPAKLAQLIADLAIRS